LRNANLKGGQTGSSNKFQKKARQVKRGWGGRPGGRGEIKTYPKRNEAPGCQKGAKGRSFAENKPKIESQQQKKSGCKGEKG